MSDSLTAFDLDIPIVARCNYVDGVHERFADWFVWCSPRTQVIGEKMIDVTNEDGTTSPWPVPIYDLGTWDCHLSLKCCGPQGDDSQPRCEPLVSIGLPDAARLQAMPEPAVDVGLIAAALLLAIARAWRRR